MDVRNEKIFPWYKKVATYIYILLLLCILITTGFLFADKINGSDFATLTIFFVVCMFVVSFKDVVYELSFLGSFSLKLKNIENDAEGMLKSIADAQRGTLKVSLDTIIKPLGSTVELFAQDQRIEPFLSIVEVIKKSGFYDENKGEINAFAEEMLSSQIEVVSRNFSSDVLEGEVYISINIDKAKIEVNEETNAARRHYLKNLIDNYEKLKAIVDSN